MDIQRYKPCLWGCFAVFWDNSQNPGPINGETLVILSFTFQVKTLKDCIDMDV